MLGTAVVASLCACGSTPAPVANAAAPAVSSPSTDSPAVPCAKQAWPQPIPASAIGNSLMHAMVGELDCFNVTKAVAPDGHDALDDDLSVSRAYVIVKVTPDVGSVVDTADEVVLTVDTHMPEHSFS
ncbi:hypothetical protein [Kitasatospora sp. NPDC058046]|uniref:hypothetical protein n=1 Tax=Kitasatospora sp. NPDC058046 TaxID=3346312 RepID=UPI0036D85C3A